MVLNNSKLPMKLLKIALKKSLIVIIIIASVVACNEDFATIDSDIINEETATNFRSTDTIVEVIAYTDALNPVQTNSLGTNLLGFYRDSGYGNTTASIVSQLSSSSFAPTFGNNVVLDSVVLTIPYSSVNLGLDEDGQIRYGIQDILPEIELEDQQSREFDSIRLSIFENNYFLRDFDPSADFNSAQPYFSNRSLSNSEFISNADLEFTTLFEGNLIISNKAIILTDNNQTVTQRLEPSIRIKFDLADNIEEDFWFQKIIAQQGNSVLSNANNFNNHFRGIYLKAENINNSGSLLSLNLAQPTSNIILYYTSDSSITEGEREQRTYELTFGPNRVNFIDNSFNPEIPLTDGNEIEGDERLYIKGGEGFLASIKLFEGTTNNINNFEVWRNRFANYDEETGEFISFRRLINEANLVFYVDNELATGEEPDRLYLYDKSNSSPLIDYFQDSQNNTLPSISIPNHLGILQLDESTGNGLRYKMRITNHINNLLSNNAQNVELGLAVSGNVNLEGTISQRLELTPDNSEKTIPVSSIITPLGTVLHGNQSTDSDKRLYLEILYTCLNTNEENCSSNN